MRISFIVPTIGRDEELGRLLRSVLRQSVEPFEIIIVEQGERRLEHIAGEYERLPIRYMHLEKRSLTAARNAGVREATGDIIAFSDDDIELAPDYFQRMQEFFEAHADALGVQGVIENFEAGHTQKVGGNRFVYLLYRVLAYVFFLNRPGRRNKLLSSARNQYAAYPLRIEICEWLSGIGAYRRSVFDTFSFDETLQGYGLGEDKLFSYRIHKKHSGSLYVDPAIRCTHVYAVSGRPEERDWVDMKVRYTWYVWNELFGEEGLWPWLAYWWANIGDMIAVLLGVLLGKHGLKVLWWHMVEYGKVFWHGKARL